MNSSDIARIESVLGLKLPLGYVNLVTSYPPELLSTDAPEFALFNRADAVIAENVAVRGKEFFGGIWPSDLIIIGANGCGDLYVTKLGDTEFTSGFFDHEVPAFFPHSVSEQEFIGKLLQESNRIDAQQGTQPDGAASGGPAG